MKISVFGMGYVGVVSAACLSSLGHDLVGVDVSAEKIDLLRHGRSPVVEPQVDSLIEEAVANGKLIATLDSAFALANSSVSIISVGTPSASNGSTSLSAVDSVVAAIGLELRKKSEQHHVVMRSTVPPGTAERVITLLEEKSGKRLGEGFTYYSNPEFLREGSAVRDFNAPPFTIVGAHPQDKNDTVEKIYRSLTAPVFRTEYRVAESVKYLCNAFHAVKIAFANEAGAILRAQNIDAREAFRILCEDRILNISAAYLRPGFAFGGSCLPKDIRGLLAMADKVDVATPFIRSVLPSNEAVVSRTFDEIAKHGRQRVSLFGLAFKSGTDDLRESPLVQLAERLIGRGFDLRIFDRSVQMARLVGSNREYIDREIPHLERYLVANPQEALEQCNLAVVGHIAAEDRPELANALRNQHVLDLSGVHELREKPGITYQGLCW